MPRRPDFYCFFYCAARERQREPGTARHAPAFRRLSTVVSSGPLVAA